MAAAFDQPGGGKQYQIDWKKLAEENGINVNEILNYDDKNKIKWLVEHDYLEELTPQGGVPAK